MRAQVGVARSGCIVGILLCASGALGDTVEERAATGISQQFASPFQINPAALPTKEAVVNAFQLSQNEESKYIFNPGDNQVAGSHKASSKDLALGGQYPLGGAAVGYHFDKYNRSISAQNAQRANRTVKEEFLTREHKLKFVVDLTNEFRAGFAFRYQTLEADLLGSHNLADADHTRYKANRSGYTLGFYYQLKFMGIGLHTSPPLRGKAEIENEQKIITQPGQDGLDFLLDTHARFKLKLGATRWTYKRDDRDDEATSPIDQRGIFLRGLDIDQYFRRTEAVSLGGEFLLTPIIVVKASVVAQEGVFLFDRSILPNKNADLETKIGYRIYRAGVSLRNKEFMAELMYSQSERESDRIRVQRGDVNLNALGTYENKSSSLLLSIGAAH